jgi:SpoIIAA-like
MPVTLHEQAAGKLLLVRLSGKLTTEDYQRWVPEVERLIVQHAKLRVLVHMHDFHGWSMGALWEDIKFDLKHFRDIERLAVVGDRKWEAGMAAFCKPFTTAKIRYFDEAEFDEAVSWINEGIAHLV